MPISSCWPPSPQTLEAFNLLPGTSQNPFLLLILLFLFILLLLFSIQVLVSSQRHCDQNKTIFQDRVLWENTTSIDGGVEGKSGDVFLLFGDLDAWNNDAAYPQFVLLTFVGLGLSNDLRIIICETNFGEDTNIR